MINEEWLKLSLIVGSSFIFVLFLLWIFIKFKKSKELPKSPQKSEVTTQLDALPEQSWIVRLRQGLSRTRTNFAYNLKEFFLSHQDKVTRDETCEKLFEILIGCDVGVETTEYLVNRIKNTMTLEGTHNYESVESLLKKEILNLLSQLPANEKGSIEHPKSHPHVVLLVGVNGVGKTTTTGKLAYTTAQKQKKVIIGAADTFRAAAIEQLAVWAKRANATLIQLKDNADPASVAFESVKLAIQDNMDLCLIDTAGRLQTRQDLMQELAKVKRVISKQLPEAPHEVLLVVDASMGQNAIVQAKLFQAAVQVTGIVLTKLDGTAKGGVVLAIASQLKLPIRYLGVGEGAEDLQLFDAHEYTEALFS